MAEDDPPKPSNENTFYIVLALVFVITVGSLGLALWKSSDRTKYGNDEAAQMLTLVPRGDATASQISAFDEIKRVKDREASNQDNIITILMGVFQAGTGAILGLLTGKATAK